MWSNSISALTECPLIPTKWMVAVNPWITLTRCDLRMSIEKENSLVEQNAFIVDPKGIWSQLVTNKTVKKLYSTEGTAQEKEGKKSLITSLRRRCRFLQVSFTDPVIHPSQAAWDLRIGRQCTFLVFHWKCLVGWLLFLQISLVFQEYLWTYRKLIINPLAERVHGQQLSRAL